MPTLPNPVIFISYSHEQKSWAKKLEQVINTRYHAWRDEKIGKGAKWWDEICEKIETCTAFAAVFTPDYLSSPYCMAELAYALKLEKPIIPIAIDISTKQLPEEIQKLQVIFAQFDLNEDTLKTDILDAMGQIKYDYDKGEYPSSEENFKPRPKETRPPQPSPTPDETPPPAPAPAPSPAPDEAPTPPPTHLLGHLWQFAKANKVISLSITLLTLL